MIETHNKRPAEIDICLDHVTKCITMKNTIIVILLCFIRHCFNGLKCVELYKRFDWWCFWPTLCSCLAMLSKESDSRKFLAPTKRRPLSSSNSRALKQQERSSSNRRTPWNCCNSENAKMYSIKKGGTSPLVFCYMRYTDDIPVVLQQTTASNSTQTFESLCECACAFVLVFMCVYKCFYIYMYRNSPETFS